MSRRTRFAGAWSAEQFDVAMRPHTRMAEHTRRALEAVLVGGQSIESAAVSAGFTRQRLFRKLTELMSEQLPDGWELAVVCLPSEELAKVREIEQRERERYRVAKEDQLS